MDVMCELWFDGPPCIRLFRLETKHESNRLFDDLDATDEDQEEYVRGLIMRYGPRCFFCKSEGHFKSDCTQFWDALADAKHPCHEEALSGVKASRAPPDE